MKICNVCGYVDENNVSTCPLCKHEEWVEEYLWDIKQISTDENFIKAMVKLYNEDPIEYQLKIAQFKNEINQKEQLEKQAQEKSTQRKCPKCGGTNFTPVRRKWSVLTGILTNKVDLVCNNCGYKWKP